MARTLGGLHDITGKNVDDLARFAVDDHNKKESTLLQFKKVVEAKQQVVAGFIFYLTLEVEDGGKNKIYEVKILEKAGSNSKEVEEFKLIGDAPAHPSA